MSELNEWLNPRWFKQSAQSSGCPLQRHLYETLKQAMQAGRLQAGAVLPGSRELARELGMGRNGVIHAYEQLAAEGYVQATRQGTVVAAMEKTPGRALPLQGHAGLSRRVQKAHRRRTPDDEMLPFMPGIPALDAFPIKRWQRLLDQARKQGGAAELSYRHVAGEPELRQAIATYLRASRGVRCTADQVLITDGTQQALELCARLLADEGDTAWIEHPGYGGARIALAHAGLKLQAITVDDQGLNPPDDWWQSRTPKLIYTTPSHQYPLGSVLSLTRRMALIERARQHGTWLLEDDYDSEFRHDGPPLTAMQGQVPGSPVVYLGTFSKTLFPALRLGFIVVPASVADQTLGVFGELVRKGHADVQRALAAFIDEGHFTQHLRRMRKLYRERQHALREAIALHWPLPHQVLGGQAGMHLVLSLPEACPDHDLTALAMQRGLSPRPLSAYSTGGIDGFNGLVMGYANTPQADMGRHITVLAALAQQAAK